MVYILTGQEKLKYIKSFFRGKENKYKILDLGGNIHSKKFFDELFHESKIITANNHKPHLNGCNGVLFDVEKNEFPFKEGEFDIIFALDIIEHLVDTDKLIEKSKSCLKPEGLFVITTPNIANIFNRIFLLLGMSFPNYHPSRYRTGNPFLKIKHSAPLWNENAHKSVFTVKGIKELLEIYSFRVVFLKGFSYSQKIKGGSESNIGIRKLINKILPTGLKEGIVIIAKKC